MLDRRWSAPSTPRVQPLRPAGQAADDGRALTRAMDVLEHCGVGQWGEHLPRTADAALQRNIGDL
ncbi:hypothetical protein F8271_31160 [Micromonospora sp. ALFpr18c]|uniref:hypothetical protein n=1 Tax=unclassified Micromonospora TaxID=2617518 RepID=UPI00124B3522|nr:hypothetical protein [Micromonospora sp. ALFpr18c]KAB1922673.1 hypothetical protein F8271_31160 [Micromonospora sp. ALFpr18c]